MALEAGKSLAKYFFKRLALFCLPFLLFVLLYAWLDPFRIIYKQDTPYGLHWNRDVQSSRLFLKNYPKYHYSSFILGNSKSMAFKCNEWGKYINDPAIFHWDASGEDLTGIYSKLKYLDAIDNPIKNVLIVTDPAVYMGENNDETFGFNQDYKINGTSALKFHYIFFKGFFTGFFYVSYIDYSLFKTYRPYMTTKIPQEWSRYVYDSITNDFSLYNRIKSIADDSLKFYSNKTAFYDRNPTKSMHWACIDEPCLSLLKEIKSILDKHKTNYKIVISPGYDQDSFNSRDLENLKQLFGSDNVYDFSGKNQYTENKGNYYDHNHYKPYIAAQLLQKIYAGKDTLIH